MDVCNKAKCLKLPEEVACNLPSYLGALRWRWRFRAVPNPSSRLRHHLSRSALAPLGAPLAWALSLPPHPPFPVHHRVPLHSFQSNPDTTLCRPPASHSTGHTSTYMRMGSPTPSISGMTHLRSNALASTILKIFCTLIDADVEQKMSDACIAFANRFA